uniref:Uncharacterized protein n=1 Tax=Micrococcus sp. MG-2010-D12 TaxID=936902 RepID=A0A0F6YRX9_9MICC|nr:hypothetical protein pJD12_220 [Micrococcus sp. MG-2010-D12]
MGYRQYSDSRPPDHIGTLIYVNFSLIRSPGIGHRQRDGSKLIMELAISPHGAEFVLRYSGGSQDLRHQEFSGFGTVRSYKPGANLR